MDCQATIWSCDCLLHAVYFHVLTRCARGRFHGVKVILKSHFLQGWTPSLLSKSCCLICKARTAQVTIEVTCTFTDYSNCSQHRCVSLSLLGDKRPIYGLEASGRKRGKTTSSRHNIESLFWVFK